MLYILRLIWPIAIYYYLGLIMRYITRLRRLSTILHDRYIDEITHDALRGALYKK